MGILQDFQFSVMALLTIGLAVANLVALADAAFRRAEAYEAAGKLTKNGWMLILGLTLGMVILLQGGFGLLIAAVATIVYFVDVRPAVSAFSRRRR